MSGALRQFSARKAVAAGGFSPLDIGWHTAYWTEGPEFTALGYANNDPVGTLPDEVSTRDATGSTTDRPTYLTSVAALNSQPALDFGPSSLQTDPFTAVPQPLTVVSVFALTSTAGTGHLWDARADDTTDRVLFRTNGGDWQYFSGAVVTDGASDTGSHLVVATYNSPSSTLEIDGTDTGAGGDTGTNGCRSIQLFNRGGLFPAYGYMAFFGLLAGTLTAGEKSDLLSWAQSHYGI